MATFTPPVNDTEVPGYDIDAEPPAKALMSYYGGGPRGRNVYYLSDGTVTEVDPDGTNTFWTRGDGTPYVVQAWWGSTADPYTVTADQATALTDAGYTVT